MSYSTLILFRDNIATPDIEMTNSWGTGPMVWDSLAKKYKNEIYSNNEPKNGLFQNWTDLWEAADNGDISLIWWEDAACHFMGDNNIIEPDSKDILIEALKIFDCEYNCSENKRVSHLTTIANRLEEIKFKIDGIGIWCNSIVENPWVIYGEDEYIPYDLSTGTKHNFIKLSKEMDVK